MFNAKNQVSRVISSFLIAGLVLLGAACALEETGSQEDPYAEPAVASVSEDGPEERGPQQEVSTESLASYGCPGFFECPTTGQIFAYNSPVTLQQSKTRCAAACSVACVKDSDCD